MFEFVFQFKFFSHPSPSEDQLGDLAEVAAHLRRNPSLAAYGLVCHRSAEWLRDRRALFGGILHAEMWAADRDLVGRRGPSLP